MKFRITLGARSPLLGNSDFTSKIETNDVILPHSSTTQQIESFVCFNLGRGFYRGGQGGGRRGRN